MSIMISETSPRALLDSALELSYTLNLIGDGADKDAPATSATSRGPGFVLKEVERVLAQIRNDLDVPEPPLAEGAEPTPLMMRLRAHINSISSVLTGNTVQFAEDDTTTLHELIESLSILNRSVCTTERRSSCVIF